MKLIPVLLAFALVAGLPASASAQDGAKKKHGRKREALLKKFDKDGDGQLNEQERAAAKEALKARRGEKDKEGKGGKRHLRKRIMKKFDGDGNGRLDESERESLRKFMDSHRGKRGKRGSK